MKDVDGQLMDEVLSERVVSELLVVPVAPEKPAAKDARKHFVNTVAIAVRALRAHGAVVVDRHAVAGLIRSPGALEELLGGLQSGPERCALSRWMGFYREGGATLNKSKMKDDLDWVAHYLEWPPEGWVPV